MSLNIPILMYHQVSNEPHPSFMRFTVTTKVFERQMQILNLLGMTPITLSRLYDYKYGMADIPGKSVIITFDDCLQDAIDNAVPILHKMGFTAVFFMTTGYAGKKSSWMIPEIDFEFRVADWTVIKDLDSMGFEIGSHSVTHPYMDDIPADECLGELTSSRKMLEEILNHKVRHMAYPHGAYNKTLVNLVEESGFLTACTTEERITNDDDGMLTLPRINMGMEDTLSDFVCKLYYGKSLPARINDSHVAHLKEAIPGPVRKLIRKYLVP